MSKKLVLVEYVKAVESSAGRADEDAKKAIIEVGTKRYVDAASAKVLVNRGDVKVVDEKAKSPAKAGPKPADAGDN